MCFDSEQKHGKFGGANAKTTDSRYRKQRTSETHSTALNTGVMQTKH